MSDAVVYALQDSVAVLRVDDGKANAFSFALIGRAARGARSRREGSEGRGLDRPGARFSGGFDLGVMRGGDLAAVGKLVAAGGRLALRLYEAPLPIVLGCTGHALAMARSRCLRRPARRPARRFQDRSQRGRDRSHAADLRDRTGARAALAAPPAARCGAGEVYDGRAPSRPGFLDLVAPADRVEGVAIEAASRLAALHLGAHHATKRRVRKSAIAVLRKSLDEDLSDIGRVAG